MSDMKFIRFSGSNDPLGYTLVPIAACKFRYHLDDDRRVVGVIAVSHTGSVRMFTGDELCALRSYIDDFEVAKPKSQSYGKVAVSLPSEMFKPTGRLCSVCGRPQYDSPSGDVCDEGHGGAESLDKGEI